MKGLLRLWMVGLAGVVLAGCARVSSQVVEKPRVDQELEGNRGYLVGSAPPAGPRKSTRQMIETNIELPTADEMNPWRTSKKAEATRTSSAAPEPAMPASRQRWQEPPEEFPQPIVESLEEQPMGPAVRHGMPAAAASSYTVKKGDNLEGISKKVYGKSKYWRKIYEANQATLKSPDRLYVGQKLVIPPMENMAEERSPSTEEYK